jgi:hypothetical protein
VQRADTKHTYHICTVDLRQPCLEMWVDFSCQFYHVYSSMAHACQASRLCMSCAEQFSSDKTLVRASGNPYFCKHCMRVTVKFKFDLNQAGSSCRDPVLQHSCRIQLCMTTCSLQVMFQTRIGISMKQ